MPSADADLTQRMKDRFGADYLDKGPCDYLKANGYTLTREWNWKKPGIRTLKDMTRDEFECLLFMCHEWDFGTIEPSEEPK